MAYDKWKFQNAIMVATQYLIAVHDPNGDPEGDAEDAADELYGRGIRARRGGRTAITKAILKLLVRLNWVVDTGHEYWWADADDPDAPAAVGPTRKIDDLWKKS